MLLLASICCVRYVLRGCSSHSAEKRACVAENKGKGHLRLCVLAHEQFEQPQ